MRYPTTSELGGAGLQNDKVLEVAVVQNWNAYWFDPYRETLLLHIAKARNDY